MKAEIIAIGDELLIGQVIDTNSVFITQQLNSIGIEINRKYAVSDNRFEITSSITDSLKRVDLVILSGGLGPTPDDITRETLAEYFNTKLVMNEKLLQNIRGFLKKRNVRVTVINEKQAELPEDCELLWNDVGAAPGMVFSREQKMVISMPGVPHELKVMTVTKLLPYLKKKWQLPPLYTQTLCVAGLPESFLAGKLMSFENKYKNKSHVAYLPSPGIVRIRIDSMKEEWLRQGIEEIAHILESYIYAFEDITLQEVTGRMLKESKKTVSVAESCTGGNISALIASVPGASEYFKGSITAYSNEIKIKELAVKADTIKNYGAVSKETVVEMALGARKKFDTDIAIATSGIAGPSGGTPDKPVGTTWIAIADHADVTAGKFHFGNERMINIERASKMALNMLRLLLSDKRKILEKMFD